MIYRLYEYVGKISKFYENTNTADDKNEKPQHFECQ